MATYIMSDGSRVELTFEEFMQLRQMTPNLSTTPPVKTRPIYNGSLTTPATSAQQETVAIVDNWESPISPKELGELLNINRGAASQRLIAATEKGLIRRIGDGQYVSLQSNISEPEAILQLGKKQREIYDLVAAHPGISQHALMKKLNRTQGSIGGSLYKLRQAGLIQDVAKGRYNIS